MVLIAVGFSAKITHVGDTHKPRRLDHMIKVIESKNTEDALREVVAALADADIDDKVKFVFRSYWLADVFRRRDYYAWADHDYKYANGSEVQYKTRWEYILEVIKHKKLFVSGCHFSDKHTHKSDHRRELIEGMYNHLKGATV